MTRIKLLELSQLQKNTLAILNKKELDNKNQLKEIGKTAAGALISSIIPILTFCLGIPEIALGMMIFLFVFWGCIGLIQFTDLMNRRFIFNSLAKMSYWPHRVRSLRNFETFNKNAKLLNQEFAAAEKDFNSMTPEHIAEIHEKYSRLRERLISQEQEVQRLCEYHEYLDTRKDTTNELALDVLETGERNADIEIIPLPATETHEELFEVVLEERR